MPAEPRIFRPQLHWYPPTTRLEFHPLSETHELHRDPDRVEDMRSNGFDGNDPIRLLSGMILDGRGRYLDAMEAGVEFACSTVGADEDPEQIVRRQNDQRRHDTPEVVKARRAKRVERVAAARADGQSIRAIAEKEGVSKTQVVEDIKEVTVQGCTVTPDKVTGKDGRQQPATKPQKPQIICARCTRIGSPVKDCLGCAEARKDKGVGRNGQAKKNKKKKPEGRKELKDKVGTVIPDQCRDAFADEALPTLIEELEHVEAMILADTWTKRAGKLCPHYPFLLIGDFDKHAGHALGALQKAIECLRAGVPHAVCPKCGGSPEKDKPCRACRNCGHVPETRYAELADA
jgi:hypothetical protein